MATIKELLGESYRDGMTLAEVEDALANANLADLSKGDYVSKGKLSDYERRMREAERKLQERLTDDEKRQAEIKAREERYKAIERENSLIKTKTKLSETIKDGKLLDEIAQLYADGNFMDALERQNSYLATARTELEKQIKTELMKKNPTPPPQDSPQPRKLTDYTMAELNKLQIENPQEYKKILYGKEKEN